MKEVKKCSISGVAFTMDADAYQELENYLDSLKKTYKDTPDGAEIVADIEARIAELILTTQDNTRVVEKPLILNIIHQMGSVEDISEESSDKKAPEEPRIPRRLYRDTENAKLGGVCAGIGKYFDVDPVWIRLGMFLPILLSYGGWVIDDSNKPTVNTQEFKDAFLKAQPTASLEGDPASWVGTIERTQSGSVHAITIGGGTVSGAQARQIFSLRSASFDVSLSGDTFTFSVTGFGHGVGMSQYGADAMAEEGKGYVEILQHYYTGVTVEECPAEYLPQ